jgi:hypothetical protein
MIDPDALKAQIRLAFSNVEAPPHWCLVSSYEGEEPMLLEKEFGAVLDRHWDELPHAFLDQAPGGYGSALSFFSDEAFRFYLPAYLIAAMEGNLQQADPVFHLTRGLGPEDRRPINPRRYGARTVRDDATYRFAVFTPAQAAAIRAFLEWFADSPYCISCERKPIREAIGTYWAARATAPV